MKKRVLLLAIPLAILMVAVVATPAMAASVNTFDVDSYQKKVDAPNSVTFEWVVFNNDTTPYLLEVTLSQGGLTQDWTANVDQNYTALAAGESRTITVTVQTTRDTPSQTGTPVTVWFNMTKMSDPAQVISVQKSAVLDVKGMFESNDKILGMWENNLPAPFDANAASFTITILIWIGIAAFFYFVVNPIVHQFTKKTKTELDDRIMEVIRMPMFALIVLYGLVDSLNILNISTQDHLAIKDFYGIVFIIIVAYTAYRIYDKVIIYYAEEWSKKTDTELDDVLVPLLHKVGMIMIPVVALMIILGNMGYDLTVLLAGMGVLGIVVAFAAQQTLSNFFAGMQIIMDRPFKVGDIIEVDSGEICEVRKIGMRSTTLYNTTDHEMIILPNNDVANKKVVNYSRPNNHRVITAEVGVAYGTDVEKVKKILMDIAMSNPNVVKEQGEMPYIRLTKFGDSSIDFKLAVWVDDVTKMWRVASDIRETIDRKFKEANIEIPFPQSVVHYVDDSKGNKSLPAGSK